jgi:NAD(P)-dependent dehydrogenase (short-subunit alcohol dehydrogenase family)
VVNSDLTLWIEPRILGGMTAITFERHALVTGAAAGIGFATCVELARLGLRVIVTARTRPKAEGAVRELIAQGAPEGALRAEALDVSDPEAVAACAARLRDCGVKVDVLVNNAALYPDRAREDEGVLDASSEEWRTFMATNFFGALWTCRAFVPGMVERGFGRVVNVSSDYGSIGKGLAGPAPYSVSKAALNALTIKLAAEVEAAPDVKVNAVHPGWVRTKMGGPNATRSPENGAEAIVWLATLPADGPSGGFFHDRKAFPW